MIISIGQNCLKRKNPFEYIVPPTKVFRNKHLKAFIQIFCFTTHKMSLSDKISWEVSIQKQKHQNFECFSSVVFTEVSIQKRKHRNFEHFSSVVGLSISCQMFQFKKIVQFLAILFFHWLERAHSFLFWVHYKLRPSFFFYFYSKM